MLIHHIFFLVDNCNCDLFSIRVMQIKSFRIQHMDPLTMYKNLFVRQNCLYETKVLYLKIRF